jgi:cyanophycin synthetase
MALTLPGDRRDEDIIETTKATIPFADAYVLYDSEDRRGRADNEIPTLMRQHLPENVPCEFAQGQLAGILQAWQQVQPGDRLIVICDEVTEALEILHTLAESVSQDTICTDPLTPEEISLPYRETNGVPVLANMPR